MKKRTLVISVLLVAALALGIGYAALTDELALNGKVSVSKDDMNSTFDQLVYFTTATTSDDSTAHITTNFSIAPKTAGYELSGFKAVNDFVTMTFTIHNAYTETVWVTLDDHVHFTHDCLTIENQYTGPIEIPADGNGTFTVTVELTKLADADINVDHNVTFTVSDTDPNAAPETETAE